MKAIRPVPRTVTARPLADAERTAMIAALSEAGLPIDDLRLPGREFFSFSEQYGSAIGYAGIEIYKEDALLRSLVLRPDMRRRGYGIAIVERMADHAARHGVRFLYLLTAKHAALFARAGFREFDREQAPTAIAATTEFKALAPTSAAFMRRTLP
jgi:N-acetylglutamate synthase-like GNAT family acetyltransferase